MRVDSALAMGTRRAPISLIAAVVAAAAMLGVPSLATAAPYPVSYDFSKGLTAQAAHPDSPPPGANDDPLGFDDVVGEVFDEVSG